MSERMIKQFMEMVQIDSESGNEANFINYLEKEYQKLGASTIQDSYGNLIAKLPAKGCEGKAPILLSCHADTVKPGVGIEPVLLDGIIRSKGDTILGADDKPGIAEMLEALRIAEVRPPVEVAISREEEIGLFGSFATNSYTDTSDIDIAYTTTSKGLTYTQELSLEDEFQNTFGKSIDLVNLKYMNPLIKRKALKDIIYVW